MRHPAIHSLQAICSEKTGSVRVQTDEGWVPARPEVYATFPHRIKAAWLVFTGKADALTWPGGQ